MLPNNVYFEAPQYDSGFTIWQLLKELSQLCPLEAADLSHTVFFLGTLSFSSSCEHTNFRNTFTVEILNGTLELVDPGVTHSVSDTSGRRPSPERSFQST